MSSLFAKVPVSDPSPEVIKLEFILKLKIKRNDRLLADILRTSCGHMSASSQSLRFVLFLFDLILYVPSTFFQLNRDGSSGVEPVLS